MSTEFTYTKFVDRRRINFAMYISMIMRLINHSDAKKKNIIKQAKQYKKLKCSEHFNCNRDQKCEPCAQEASYILLH